jgi:glycosyltransferase involved in cell wall biosynthesis
VSEGGRLRVAVSSIGRFYMFDLARALRQAGDVVSLFTGYPRLKVDPDLRPVARTRPWWVLAGYARTLVPPMPTGTWWAQRSLDDFGPWLARTLDPDTVDVLDAIAGTGWEAGRVLRRHGKPWICNRGSTHILTQKALLEEEHRRWDAPAPDFSRGIDRCLGEYEECDAVIVPSRFAKRSFVDQGVAAEKVFVCPYGVDLSMFSPRPKEDDRFRVLFVGAFSIRKGIGDLFEAVRPLVRRDQGELWLVGSRTPDGVELLRRNADIVIDKGVQPRAALAWFYSQASVVVLPSVEDGFGLVLAQAMACGVPVIASANTGGEDLFTDGVEGFVVPARAPDVLRERLQWMLDNPVRRREMGAAARERVKDLGGWASFARDSRNVYLGVGAGAPARRPIGG